MPLNSLAITHCKNKKEREREFLITLAILLAWPCGANDITFYDPRQTIRRNLTIVNTKDRPFMAII